MKDFKIDSCDAFDLGSLLIYYADGYSKFFKVWGELKKEFKDFNLKVTDYNLTLIQITADYSYKWINISCSEQYIREHLLSLLVDDVEEYLAVKNSQPIPAKNEEIQMMADAGLDLSMFDL